MNTYELFCNSRQGKVGVYRTFRLYFSNLRRLAFVSLKFKILIHFGLYVIFALYSSSEYKIFLSPINLNHCC